jgi:coenzyme F420-reducing hydrogenase delta subunit
MDDSAKRRFQSASMNLRRIGLDADRVGRQVRSTDDVQNVSRNITQLANVVHELAEAIASGLTELSQS